MQVPWSDGRQDEETRAGHAERTRRLHRQDAAYRRAALQGLEKGRRQRRWADDAILNAIRDYHGRTGRWPGQHDFRSANGLPGYGTVQRRHGSHVTAVHTARELADG